EMLLAYRPKASAASKNPKPQIPNPKPQEVGIWFLGFGIWDLLRAALIEDLVDPRDGGFLEARPIDVAVMLAMPAEVDPPGGLRDRHLLIVQRLRLVPEVAQQRLEVGDLILSLERLAVAGDDGLEVEHLQLFEIVRPLV